MKPTLDIENKVGNRNIALPDTNIKQCKLKKLFCQTLSVLRSDYEKNNIFID